jgi:hypothetical protein
MPITSRALADRTSVSVGLLDTEIVLRGGYLLRPEILTNIRLVDDRKFVPLWKSCPVLNKFLTSNCYSKHPLKGCTFFNAMKVLREQKRADISAEWRRVGTENIEKDKADDLGLEAEPVVRGRRRSRAIPKHTLPKYVEITMLSGGLGRWTLTVLLESQAAAIVMEASQLNFDKLAACVHKELGVPSGRAKSVRKPINAAFSPRGPKTAREYFSKSKNQWFRNTKTDHALEESKDKRLRAGQKGRGLVETIRPFAVKAGSFTQTRLTNLFKLRTKPVLAKAKRSRMSKAGKQDAALSPVLSEADAEDVF